MSVTKVQIVGDLTKDKPKPKGFKRSQKEWEASIAEHVGKFFDKMTIHDILRVLLDASLFVVGCDIAARENWNNPLWGGIQNLVMLEFARTPYGNSSVGSATVFAYWLVALMKASAIYSSPPGTQPGTPPEYIPGTGLMVYR